MSLVHWILVFVVVIVLFGAGRIPRVMGDIGKGVRSLRDELNKDERSATAQEVLPPEDKK